MMPLSLATLVLAAAPTPLGQSHWVYKEAIYDFKPLEAQYFLAPCPTGEWVKGGGQAIDQLNVSYIVKESHPAPNGVAWAVQLWNSTKDRPRLKVTVWALCEPAGAGDPKPTPVQSVTVPPPPPAP